MKLAFHGAARQMTGSNYLLEEDGLRILIDCGLFQGSKYAETLNYSNFSYDPKDIDFVLLTHSHADHTGRLPKLYRDGFRGKVFATKPTVDLSLVSLEDNLDLIKDEARKDGHEPLFSLGDLHQAFLLTQGVEYGQEVDLSENVKAVFHNAGHILGSAIIEIKWKTKAHTPGSEDRASGSRSVYFSGDLGNYPNPLLKHYDMPNEADYIVVESTYGDRIHDRTVPRKDVLKEVIGEALKKNGTVIIPTFAIERTQELLYELDDLIERGSVPRVPVFLDSPLAIKLTKIYKNHSNYFNKKAIHEIRGGDDIFDFSGLKLTFSSQESKAINEVKPPKIIIAGSGMSFGGRILYHEIRYLPDYNSAILFIGYQVSGSPGRQILDGKKEVRLLGQPVAVNCKIKAIENYSAHADQPMLLDWVGKAEQDGNLKRVFITHGEPAASDVLKNKIMENLDVEAIVPGMGEEYILD